MSKSLSKYAMLWAMLYKNGNVIVQVNSQSMVNNIHSYLCKQNSRIKKEWHDLGEPYDLSVTKNYEAAKNLVTFTLQKPAPVEAIVPFTIVEDTTNGTVQNQTTPDGVDTGQSSPGSTSP